VEWFIVHAVAQQARTVKGVAGCLGVDRRKARRWLSQAGVDRSEWPTQQEIGARYWQQYRKARGIEEPPASTIAAASSIGSVARQFGCGRKLVARLMMTTRTPKPKPDPRLKSALKYLRAAEMVVIDMGPDYACLYEGRRYVLGPIRMTIDELLTRAQRNGWKGD
jgi:transposase-like protein